MKHNCEHKCADKCHDQLPAFVKAGRGLRGDSYSIKINDDEIAENLTYLEAYAYDAITKTETKVWTSDNINGGRLECFYHLNKQDRPQTFTLTFIYTRPDSPNDEDPHKRTRWAFTTPAIPYMHEGDTPMQGSIVGTIFLKDHMQTTDDKYKEMLTYPKVASGTPDRNDFNAPYPPGGRNKIVGTIRSGDKPTSSSTFLPDGSEWNVYLDVVEFNEFISVTGLTKTQLKGIIQNPSDNELIRPSSRSTEDWSTFANVKSDNIKDYIDDMFQAESTARGTKDRSLQNQIDALKERIRKLEQYVSGLANANNDAFQDLLNKIYGSKNGHAGTANVVETNIPSGEITLTKIPKVEIEWDGMRINDMVATGNMNVLSDQTRGTASNPEAVYIRTHNGNDKGDYKTK